MNSVLCALFWHIESGKFIGTKQCDTKMPMVYIYMCARVRVPYLNIYGVGFGVAVYFQRQYQSQMCGTARLQSRFLFVYMYAGKNMIFDILDYRKKKEILHFCAKLFAYVRIL